MTERKRRCPRCGVTKNLNAFYKSRRNKNGKTTYCKKCTLAYVNLAYAENLHGIRERKRRGRNSLIGKTRKIILEHLKKHPCVDCGEDNIIVLDFDHRDPADKHFTIGGGSTARKPESIKKEIQKCDVRCSNCHRKKTAKERNSWRLDPEYYLKSITT